MVKMSSKPNGFSRGVQKLEQIQGNGPNWALIIGGAILSTLSIKIGCKLKHIFDGKRLEDACNGLKGNDEPAAKLKMSSCTIHSNMHNFTREEESCYYCRMGTSESGLENKRASTSAVSMESYPSLPLVVVPSSDSRKENGGTFMSTSSSPEGYELPPRPINSNGTDSPCISECSSDIFTKREVIHKLRQQLKRRDEMIMDMQAQITDLQSSLRSQSAHSEDLQSQLESASHYLFDSEREIQRLRKAVVDHRVMDKGPPEKSFPATSWHAEANGHLKCNGHVNGMNGFYYQHVEFDKRIGGAQVEMLKGELLELKKVMEGKEFLLQSYKEQNAELSARVQELQSRLNSQVPNIL